jgi:DNA-directed RNA polymerase subunit RPC12/RpoP
MRLLSPSMILILSFLRSGRTLAFVSVTRRQPPTFLTSPFSLFPRASRSLSAKPKRGNVVDSYQTVSVSCAKCGFRLFRYKKKNGTKSSLVKCFVERIVEDYGNVLLNDDSKNNEDSSYACPSCETTFARSSLIRGLPALKLVGGKTRMTKK